MGVGVVMRGKEISMIYAEGEINSKLGFCGFCFLFLMLKKEREFKRDSKTSVFGKLDGKLDGMVQTPVEKYFPGGRPCLPG